MVLGERGRGQGGWEVVTRMYFELNESRGTHPALRPFQIKTAFHVTLLLFGILTLPFRFEDIGTVDVCALSNLTFRSATHPPHHFFAIPSGRQRVLRLEPRHLAM